MTGEASESRGDIHPTPPHRTGRSVFWVVLCVALLARLAVFSVNSLRDEPRFLQPDSRSYIETARSLLEHGAVQDDAGRPGEGRVPAYPLVLAFIFATGLATPLRLTG